MHTMMKAAVLEATGGPENIRYREIEKPDPLPGHVLVAVKACGVAYRDIIERRGGHPLLRTPIIQGHEFTGEVVAVGHGVTRWAVGDRVLNLYANSCGYCEDCVGGDERRCTAVTEMYGLVTNGGYAEYALVQERGLERLHDQLDYETGACIMSAVSVAYNNVSNRLQLRPGEKVLVTGASGGVGSAALQFCKQLGAEVWAVTGSESKRERLLTLGADRVLVDDGRSIHKQVRSVLPQGLDTAIDCVGSTTLGSVLKSMRRLGRVAAIGTINPEPLPLNLGTLVVNGLQLLGSDGTTRQSIRESMALVARGSIQVDIDRRMPLAEAAQAHRLLEARQVNGRVLLIP